MKRFYKEAGVADVNAGFGVALDGKPVRTPGKAILALPNTALADAVAGEWRAQGEEVEPNSMPLMRLGCTAIDRVAQQREAIIDEVAGYGGADLLCYWAGHPAELQRRQAATWQPMLDWAERALGASLAVTEGVVHVTQEAPALAKLHTAVAAHDHWMLTALHTATTVTGSLVLGLALAHEEIDAERAWTVCRLDHDYQAEKWGEDDEAGEAAAGLRAELDSAVRFMALQRGSSQVAK